VLPRPRLRAPLWAAFAIAVAAYVVRSVMRGFDFRPDLPTDAVVLVALFVAVALVFYVRLDDTKRDSGETADDNDSADPHSMAGRRCANSESEKD